MGALFIDDHRPEISGGYLFGMKVLIGCEESGKVRDAFEKRGHDAWSNDIIPARNGGKHLQMCVTKAINSRSWDLIILHPDCTALTVAGNSTYGTGMPKNAERHKAIKWTHDLFALARNNCGGVALENPVGVLGVMGGVHATYIHPWQFGHPEQKKTCLWLKGLPELIPTNNVFDEMMKLPKCKRERNHYMSPGPNRKRDRSETYQGIADAMAEQWGSV